MRFSTLAACGAGVMVGGVAVGQGGLELISVKMGAAGGFANGASFASDLTPDGRYALFTSSASNLVAGDTNSAQDLFVRDRSLLTTQRASLGAGGAQANGDSGSGVLSGDGRWMAFLSGATNLVAGDTNGLIDIFARDLVTGQVLLVSHGLAGAPANSPSYSCDMSRDGRFIVFASSATNLVSPAGLGTEGVFLYDRFSGLNTRLDVGPGGAAANADAENPRIAADGSYVVFRSFSTNLVTPPTGGPQVFGIAIPGGTVELLSKGPGGVQPNSVMLVAGISSDGRRVLFLTSASNLGPVDGDGARDLYLLDRQTGVFSLVSVGPGGSAISMNIESGSLSGDARFITMSTIASLVAADTNNAEDVYVRDLTTGRVTWASQASIGGGGNADSTEGPFSMNGGLLLFTSFASDFGGDDANATADVFVWKVATCAGDLNGDGAVNSLDLAVVLGAWGVCP